MKRYFLLALGFLFTGFVFGKEIPYLAKSGSKKTAGGSFKTVEELCQPAKAQTDLNLNNVRTTILGGGDMWWDLNQARYEVPKGSNKHSMFAGALWLGGIDDGQQLKMAAMTYRQRGNDFWPGPLTTDGTASVTKTVCDRYDRHWVIFRDEVEIHKGWLECLDDPNCNDAVEYPGYESNIPRSILEWPGNGAEGELPYKMAPFEDRDGDQFYDPFIDYPNYDIDKKYDCRLKETDILYGDQTIWWVYNDRGNVHTETQAGALGFEIRAQAFAFSTNDEVNNMTFNNYRIINKSTFRLTETYFSTWFDPDLGNPNDDIIGSDIPRGLGYCYNADTEDEGPLGYGFNPPAIGFDFFQGPFADYFDGADNDRDGCIDAVKNPVTGICEPENPATGINERIIMSGFMYYNNTALPISGNPDNGTEFYNYMRSLWKNGDPLEIDNPSGPGDINNGNGHRPGSDGANKTLFAYPGVTYDTTETTPPTAPVNWYESPANKEDKRGLHNAGPFSLAPGALNFITTGVVWERDLQNNELFSSVEKVIVADDKAQQLFDNCFRVLDGPDAPDMDIQELDRQLIINLSYKSASNNYQYTYRERDPLIPVPEGDLDSLLEVNPNYFHYIFEGYQIFQLRHKDVSVSDLYISSEARLVAQVDVKNDITQLINWEVDPNLNQLVPQDMTLEANNEGVGNSFVITEDQFATGDRSLINDREYYFLVLAYGQNQFEVFDPTSNPNGQRKPYLAGRKNIQTYTAIPHQTTSERDGTVISSNWGDGVVIKRIEGIGNGSNDLELLDEVHDDIVSNFKVEYPIYQNGRGPVNVIVVDPLAVPDGNYTIAFDGYDDDARWIIYPSDDPNTVIARSDSTISFFNEQIIPDLGLAVRIAQHEAAGGDEDGERANGTIRGESIPVDATQAWLSGVPDGQGYNPINWILAGANTNATDYPARAYIDYEGDPKGYFTEFISGTWGPTPYVSPNQRGYQNDPDNGTAITNYGLGPVHPIKRPTLVAIKKVHSVDVVFTNDRSKWTRVPVIELSEDSELSEGKAKKHTLRKGNSWNLVDPSNPNSDLVRDPSNTGWSYFPGYAIDLETGTRLNMIIGENSWVVAERGNDMRFNPTSTFLTTFNNINGGYVLGGQHAVHVMMPYDTLMNQFGNRIDYRELAYAGDRPEDNPMYDVISQLDAGAAGSIDQRNMYDALMWTSYVMLSGNVEDFDMMDGMPTETKVSLRMTIPYGPLEVDNSNNHNPMYEFQTSNIAVKTGVVEVAESALDNIRAVPNPYYGWSEYETSQLDNIVKITNLPERCRISIFSTNGTLVRTIDKANTSTWVEWDLKNQSNVPIASGVYIIHIDAEGIGEKVIKWFGALRPVDLNAF